MSTFLLIAAVVLALVIGLFAFHAAAAPAPAAQLPDTTAGRRVAAFLAAFNSGQDEQLRQVLAGQFDPQALQTMPLETRLHTLKQLLAETGKLELLTVGAVNDRELTVVAKGSRRGTRLDLTFLFAPGEVRRHDGIGIAVAEIDALAGFARDARGKRDFGAAFFDAIFICADATHVGGMREHTPRVILESVPLL